MPEVQEVFQMATQKVRPDPDALERQHRDQRRHVAKKKAAVFALITVLAVAGGIFGISALRSVDEPTIPGSSTSPTATFVPLPSGPLEPGTYIFRTLDPEFDASHRITIDVPDGYEGDAGFRVDKAGQQKGEVGVSVWAVGNVYADPCDWAGTLLDPAASSVDGVVAALASQQRLRVSTPTTITVDGFPATYMERTAPAGITLANCHQGQFRTWLATDGGARWVQPGQNDLLWIIDVDDVPVLIDATLAAGTSAQDRSELVRIVESIRIDLR